jgi:CBS domain containing-hemolysin-like protein
MADVAADEEAIEREERRLIHSIFEFGDTVVREVMVPRPDMVAIEAEATVEEAISRAIEAGYSRIPCYRETTDDIVGLVYLKDLVQQARAGAGRQPVRVAVRDAVFVPEQKRVAELLREMRTEKFHMAVVIDEHGGTAGIVTLEDLLEEIVGDIEDEFDLPNESVERVSETTVRIDGSFTIDDFNEEFGTGLDTEDFHTVAGFVFGHLGRAAEVGDEIAEAQLRFRVLETSGSRIQRLEVEFMPAPIGADDTPEAA